MTESTPTQGPVVLPDPLPDTLAASHELLIRFWYRILELQKQVRRRSRDIHGPKSARVDIDDIEGEGKKVYEETIKQLDSEREELGQPPPPTHGGGGRNAPSCVEDERTEHHRITDAAQLLCPCCNVTCTSAGATVSYQLTYIPARYQRVKHVEYTYSCPTCHQFLVSGSKPTQPIEKSYADPSVIANVARSKLEYHLPLYRQEQIILAHGVPIDRSTMSRWLKRASDELRILYDRMRELIRLCVVIESDETNMPFIRKGAGKTIKGKISLYRGDKTAPYNLYNFTEDGRGDNHTRFLSGFTGFLLTDGTNVYNGVLCTGDFDQDRDGAISANCWAHVYRYFEDAKKAEEKLADYAIGVIKSIFKIEELADKLTEEERVALRQKMTKPLIEKLKRWLDQQELEAAPTAFKDAVQYTLNRWPALLHFLDHGFLKAHNNDSENALRPVVLGRGNWLFMGSADGGQTAAILMSFIQTCRRLKIDSFEYLKDVLSRLPDTPISEIDQFLPDRWKAAREANQKVSAAA